MKCLIFCFDGTTNTLDTRFSTNVVKTAQSLTPIADQTAQFIYYDKGVGTDEGEKFKGGAFGFGVTKNLYEAYAFLIFNYSVGDEIYVFGFSRGAYTARSFVGLIYNCGILRRRDVGKISEAIDFYKSRDNLDKPLGEKMMEFRRTHSPLICISQEEDEWRCRAEPKYKSGDAPLLTIQFVGVWDTVGALGVPDHMKLDALIDGDKYYFHDTRLAPFVLNARHAVAIDEHREAFAPTLWNNIAERNQAIDASPSSSEAPYQQQWFPGDHGSVGGGGDREGLSDQAFKWIIDGAREAGLHVDSDPSSRIYEIVPDFRERLINLTAPLQPSIKKRAMDFLWRRAKHANRTSGPTNLYEVSISAKRRWLDLPENLIGGEEYRPTTLDGVADQLNALKPKEFGVGVPLDELNDKIKFEFHTVKQGESLSKISGHYYGDTKRYIEILEANRDTLEDPEKLDAGSTLRIPKPILT